MRIELEDERNLLSPEDREVLERCAEAAQRAENVSLPLGVYVRITGDAEIRDINRQTRGMDRATDVLSFPSVTYSEGMTAGEEPQQLLEAYDAETGVYMLGDVIISADHMRAQALEYGHSQQRECGYLLTHALFHLMGYDHMTEPDKKKMRAQEERALSFAQLKREEV